MVLRGLADECLPVVIRYPWKALGLGHLACGGSGPHTPCATGGSIRPGAPGSASAACSIRSRAVRYIAPHDQLFQYPVERTVGWARSSVGPLQAWRSCSKATSPWVTRAPGPCEAGGIGAR